MMVQSLLRHAMAEAISEGIINCLIVTSSAEANVQLTRIHEHLFARTLINIPPHPERSIYYYYYFSRHRGSDCSGGLATPNVLSCRRERRA